VNSTVNPSQPKNQRVQLTTAVPGPKSQALRQREDAHMAPGLQGYAVMAGIVVQEGRGSTVTDVDGNTFVDFIGGINVNALGHSHPRFVADVQDPGGRRLGGIVHLAGARGAGGTAWRKSRRPPGCTACSSTRAARKRSRAPCAWPSRTRAKYEFISFWGGFHGKTMGSLSLMGSTFKHKLGPMVPGSHQVPYADCYRCPLHVEYPGCGLACADLVRQHAKTATAGGGGVHHRAHAGNGRQHHSPQGIPARHSQHRRRHRRAPHRRRNDHRLRPHRAALGRGSFRRAPRHRHHRQGLWRRLSRVRRAHHRRDLPGQAVEHSLGFVVELRRQPAGLCRRSSALRIIDEERLEENSKAVGAMMLRELQGFEQRFPFVGFVQGSGLFLRVELVKDRKTKEPLPRKVTERIFMECVRRGLLTMSYTASFRLQPALTIDEATAKNGLAILGEVFETVEREKWWQ
jgi:4-aminobutyrate aminotransferase/(S)-3-amino-2-methylpropionate transaminase